MNLLEQIQQLQRQRFASRIVATVPDDWKPAAAEVARGIETGHMVTTWLVSVPGDGKRHDPYTVVHLSCSCGERDRVAIVHNFSDTGPERYRLAIAELHRRGLWPPDLPAPLDGKGAER